MKKIAMKAGLAPGTLVHIGEARTDKVKMEVIDYSEASFEQKAIERVEECFPFKARPTITWVNIDGVHDIGIIEKIGKEFRINDLVLEDIVNTEQRPQAKDFGSFIFIVLKMAKYDPADDELLTEQVSLVVGSNFVISFQEGKEGDVFGSVRERIRAGKDRIRKMGADYLAHALMDASVDSYFTVLEQIGMKLEDVEDETLNHPTPKTLEQIHKLKRNLIFLRKAVWPVREVASFLERSESPLIEKTTKIYFRDIFDHSLQLIDLIETFRDVAAGMLDIYLSSLSNRMNEVIKVLTIISTIFIPLTFLAGLYGMNFKNMPELGWRFGYYGVLALMVAIVVFMLFFFKRKRWI
ncbi:MAG: magnesium/cobalt transporter CorA [Acidobacteria bacterium]|nr:magnesium/cobalt transporter CorA [Acidobacteriota bacterium]